MDKRDKLGCLLVSTYTKTTQVADVTEKRPVRAGERAAGRRGGGAAGRRKQRKGPPPRLPRGVGAARAAGRSGAPALVTLSGSNEGREAEARTRSGWGLWVLWRALPGYGLLVTLGSGYG